MSFLVRFFFTSATFLVVSASLALGDGAYQQTKDGRTTIWNNDPKSGDEATWFGERDREGYATGVGTLTWYSGKKETVRYLGIPLTRSDVYARYFGNMVRGKFDGPVNVHSKGKIAHALFVDGNRKGRWAGGPAPSRRVAQQMPQIEPAKKHARNIEPEAPAVGPVANATPAPTPKIVEQKRAEPIPKEAEIESPTPAATPSPTPSPKIKPVTVAANPPPKPKPASDKKPKAPADNSLELLARPPSSLHNIPPGAPAPETHPRLTKDEVVDLARAEVRRRGFDPAQNQSAQPEFNAADGTWSWPYDSAAAEGAEEAAKHFSVIIDDKTKGTLFVPRK